MKSRQMTREAESRERESNRNQGVVHTALYGIDGYERLIKKDLKERRNRPGYMVER